MTQLQAKIDERSEAAGAGFRAFVRFGHSRATLLAAGTTYYIFLAMFSLIAVAFGLTALLGSEAVSKAVDNALASAFPNLGGSGVDPEALQQFGQAASIVGLLVLLYSGSGAMVATSNSVHLIYGAPKDGRNFAWARARLLAWMILIAPLILISFSASLVVGAFAAPILEWLGTTGTAGELLLRGASTLVSLAIGFVVVFLILAHLGGIRPSRRSLVIGAVVGAIGIEILKSVMSSIVSWSVSKPQYGAFAVPITVLLVLYLLTLVTYVAASLTAGVAETDGAATEADTTAPDAPPTGTAT